MVTNAISVQPLLSVVSIATGPAGNPVTVVVVCPVGIQINIYGVVPPPDCTAASPSLPPKHETLLVLITAEFTADGSAIN